MSKLLIGVTAAVTSILAEGVALADDSAAATEGAAPKVPTVVVTATPLSTDPDFLATIVDAVPRDEILRKGGANLADSLSDVPGVTGTSFALGASRPIIRGFDAQRVRTLEDGIGSFDVSDVGPDHGVPIDPLAAQQVEVVRGAATLRYGSQAIGGVVNATNNRVPLTLPDRPISGEVTGSYGSNADTRQGAGLLDGAAGDFAFHLDGFGRRTNDYDIPGGRQGNSFFRGDGVSGGTSYFFGPDQDPSHVGVAVIHYDSKYGIPSDTTYIDMKQTKELLRSSFTVDYGALQKVTVEGGYAEYRHTENEPDGTVDSTFRDREWDSRVEAVFGQLGPFSGAAVGLQAQRKNFSALGEDSDYLFPTVTQTEALFAFAESPLSQVVRLQAGARVEHVKIDGTPASDVSTTRNFTPVSGSVGVVYDATSTVRLGLTASSAARAPAQTELFARGG
ncbi:MAG: TonB-dependent receptor, partial [Solimonas sp.]